ncbi:hypothetical protein DFH07DRAFT_777420 [Mycena maculata]|uniref:Uncharacterized protein n=1 Tax=Mycena maculata TaxID=230809 RepID=A0AAD7N2I7_9AGAR|nr:hypothetical protein DFH07DRAFT_777420 [Mycena maculata]
MESMDRKICVTVPGHVAQEACHLCCPIQKGKLEACHLWSCESVTQDILSSATLIFINVKIHYDRQEPQGIIFDLGNTRVSALIAGIRAYHNIQMEAAGNKLNIFLIDFIKQATGKEMHVGQIADQVKRMKQGRVAVDAESCDYFFPI